MEISPHSQVLLGNLVEMKTFALRLITNSYELYPVVHFSNGVKMAVREESVFQGGASGAM